jgi:putative ABC transport system substrate-binding protein
VIDRGAFIYGASFVLLAAPLAVEAQQAGKVPRIGVLVWYAPDPGVQELFRQGFREAGYVEGLNVSFEWRWAERKAARAAELAQELVRLNVDVLVVHPTPAIKPAQNATRTIPIVVLAANPVGTGAAASLARPGGNTTGVSTNSVELAGKRLELLREIRPRMSRVGFLASLGDANGPLFVDQTRATAQRMGIQIMPQFVRGPRSSTPRSRPSSKTGRRR